MKPVEIEMDIKKKTQVRENASRTDCDDVPDLDISKCKVITFERTVDFWEDFNGTCSRIFS